MSDVTLSNQWKISQHIYHNNSLDLLHLFLVDDAESYGIYHPPIENTYNYCLKIFNDQPFEKQ